MSHSPSVYSSFLFREMALAHQTRWGVSRSSGSKGSWACKQCLYDFLPACPLLYHPSSWVGHEKRHGQRGSGVLDCRTLLSLEDGCSHWLQACCFHPPRAVSGSAFEAEEILPRTLRPCRCLFRTTTSVLMTQLYVCWYSVPDLSQAAIQTTSRFQYGAPLKATGAVFSTRFCKDHGSTQKWNYSKQS